MGSPYNKHSSSKTTSSQESSTKNTSSSSSDENNSNNMRKMNDGSDKLQKNQDEQEKIAMNISDEISTGQLDLSSLSKLILPPLGDSSSSNYQTQIRSNGWIISPMNSKYRYVHIYIDMKMLSNSILYIYVALLIKKNIY